MTPIPTVTPFRTATPVPLGTTGRALPNNGAPAAVIALSGLSLVELGIGFRVLARRLQRPWMTVPAYLMRSLVRAARRGEAGVEIGGGWYLERREVERPKPTIDRATAEAIETEQADRRAKRMRPRRWFG